MTKCDVWYCEDDAVASIEEPEALVFVCEEDLKNLREQFDEIKVRRRLD